MVPASNGISAPKLTLSPIPATMLRFVPTGNDTSLAGSSGPKFTYFGSLMTSSASSFQPTTADLQTPARQMKVLAQEDNSHPSSGSPNICLHRVVTWRQGGVVRLWIQQLKDIGLGLKPRSKPLNVRYILKHIKSQLTSSAAALAVLVRQSRMASKLG